MLSASARVGFQGHVDRTVNGLGSHVNAIPILLGAMYHLGGDRQGLFGAFEMGMFDLMSSVERRQGGNVVAVASRRALPVDALEAQLAEFDVPWRVADGAPLDDFVGDAPVLTDDHAPVDQLLTPYAAPGS